MPVEIEKKYRLTKRQRDALLRRLSEVGAAPQGEVFEENVVYSGAALDRSKGLLRLRRVGKKVILTYKEHIPSASAIKHRHEDETRVSDGDAMAAILAALGFTPALVYEKRRATWRLGEAEIAIDELPFGLFMEIEGPESEIRKVERQLAIKGLKAEHATYPQLTARHGQSRAGLIEVRFSDLSDLSPIAEL